MSEADDTVPDGRRDCETYISLCKALACHPRADAGLRIRFLELIERFANTAMMRAEEVVAIAPASDEAIEIFKEVVPTLRKTRQQSF